MHSSKTRGYLFALLICLLCLPAASTTADPKLKTGKMLVGVKGPERGKWPLKVRVLLPVEATQEEIWKLLTDYDHQPEFIPHMKECQVISREGDRIVIKQVFGFLFLSMNMETAIHLSPPSRINFQRIKGNMEVYDGYWGIEPLNPGTTLLTLEIEAKPGFYVPRWTMSALLKKEVPEGLLAIRKKALEDMGKREADYPLEVIPLEGF